jgi:hypothetical protein
MPHQILSVGRVTLGRVNPRLQLYPIFPTKIHKGHFAFDALNVFFRNSAHKRLHVEFLKMRQAEK